MAVISGIGWVTAAGLGCGKDHDSFSMPNERLAAIERGSVFDRPYKNFGRMDEFSRLGLAGVTFALRDAGLEQWDAKRSIGIIATTDYGCLWTDIDYYETVVPHGGSLASPNLFAYTLPNCFLGEAAIRFGLTGESFVVNASSVIDLVGLQMALDSIQAEEIEKIVCGCCDLGRPPSFDGKNETPPGALFFVIESQAEQRRGTYGDLELPVKGGITLNGTAIADLVMLADVCLKSKTTNQKT